CVDKAVVAPIANARFLSQRRLSFHLGGGVADQADVSFARHAHISKQVRDGGGNARHALSPIFHVFGVRCDTAIEIDAFADEPTITRLQFRDFKNFLRPLSKLNDFARCSGWTGGGELTRCRTCWTGGSELARCRTCRTCWTGWSRFGGAGHARLRRPS